MQPALAVMTASAPVLRMFLQFAARQSPGHFWLRQVISSSSAAAQFALGQFAQLQSRDHRQQPARSFAYFLRREPDGKRRDRWPLR